MGFFSRKKKDEEDDIPMLRTLENGGLDKIQVYEQISLFRGEIKELENAIMAMQKGKPFRVPADPTLADIKKVNSNGFDSTDVNAYFSKLRFKINELKAQLN